MSIPSRKKLRKSIRSEPSHIEEEIAQALFDLEMHNQHYKKVLSNFYVNSVKPLELPNGKASLLLFYPLRFKRKLQKVQRQLTGELEKKFSGKQVFFLGQRKIARQSKSSSVAVKRNRTITSVHSEILDDLLFPADVVGRRVKYAADGQKVTKIFLDVKEREKEGKADAVSTIYKRLTGKDITLGFMSNSALQQII